MVSLAIEELPLVIKEDVEDFLENHPRSPAARLRPRMGMVGDIWLAFIGPEVRRGASGLGGTPRDALKDFNQHFMFEAVLRTKVRRQMMRNSGLYECAFHFGA